MLRSHHYRAAPAIGRSRADRSSSCGLCPEILHRFLQKTVDVLQDGVTHLEDFPPDAQASDGPLHAGVLLPLANAGNGRVCERFTSSHDSIPCVGL